MGKVKKILVVSKSNKDLGLTRQAMSHVTSTNLIPWNRPTVDFINNVAIVSTVKVANEYSNLGFISYNTNEIEKWLHHINILTHIQEHLQCENIIQYIWSHKTELIKLPQALNELLCHRLKSKLLICFEIFDEYIKVDAARNLFPLSPSTLYYLIQDLATAFRHLHSIGISYGQEITVGSLLWTKSSQGVLVPFLYNFSKSKLWKFAKDENELEVSRNNDIRYFIDFMSELIQSSSKYQSHCTDNGNKPSSSNNDENDSINSVNMENIQSSKLSAFLQQLNANSGTWTSFDEILDALGSFGICHESESLIPQPESKAAVIQ
ncbi:uncharacterized protein TRIADDRAFT_55174 [Trichoplax adhaerens]|uniref:Protein kinase domain-containing protein n=1 Tax=Trichoplax adhaerens TaxID=10228 RepID=B3RU67_TRIAD|nr:predicted protein [Trichoplax adhaerens]EDV25285.1 predicted protein [Trichoplax adhaerens]|eukprot:XP_002111318.1 predicted protein [Trichoplax adhaerens]